MSTPSRKSALAATFIEEFRAEMTRQGVDRYELAVRLGCTPENVYQLLHSNPGLRLFTAERLAKALGLRLEIRLVAHDPASEAKTTHIAYTPEAKSLSPQRNSA